MAFGSTGTQDRGTRGNNGQNPGRESPLRKFTKCCFFIACFVCLTLVDCIDNLDPRDSDAPKELKEPKIRSLPVRRKRALTLPLSTSKDQIKLWKKQRTKDQLQSLLFSRLNYDIRRIIYEYLLCVPKGRELHVAVSSSMSWGKPSSERVSGIPCHARQPDGPSCWHSCWLPDDLLYQSRRDRPLPENPCVISLGLLRSFQT